MTDGAERGGAAGGADFPSLLQERYGIPVAGAAPAAGGETLAGMLARATCRRFLPDPVPEPLLATLLACAQSAPSKSDLQQYAIVVVEQPAARREIASWLPTMPWVAEAPLFLVFCGDLRRARRVCAMQGRPHANDNMDTFLNTAVDGALAMGAFIAAAEAAGLGTCPISYVRNHLERIAPLLALPPGVYPLAGLCVGFPAARSAVSLRLPPAVVVHRDRYDDAGLEPALRDYDRRRCERQPIPPEKQKNAQVYGTTPRGTWSDQVSRQLSLPERAGFRDFLRGHGFELA